LEVINNIEPKPGIPPSPSHIAAVAEQMKASQVKAILTEVWHERRTPDLLAKKTGATVVVVSVMPGGSPDTPDYPSVCKAMAKAIAGALK
jgi:ABC-type Zn uptake system ZnuABC Zn-binding protein ZnuA